MNIFEALKEGNGRATFYECRNVAYWWIDQNCKLMVIRKDKPSEAADTTLCLQNDWIPYVPRETPKMGNYAGKVWKVYYALCMQAVEAGYSQEMIEKMITRPDKSSASFEKKKHKEVFEKVEWCKNFTMNIVYPSRDIEQWTKLERFVSMPPMTMTLEWEE